MSRPRSIAETMPVWRRLWRHAAPAVRRERPLLVGTTTALLAEMGLRLLEPWPLKLVFDTVLAVEPKASGLPWLDTVGRDGQLIAAAAALLAITAVRAAVAYASTIGGALAGSRIVARLREALYTHLQRLPLSFHARSRTGDLTVRLTSDVNVMKDATVTALLPLVSNMLVLVGMAAVMAWFHWQLALVAMALLPVLALSTRRLGRRIHDTATSQRRHEGNLAARAAESLAAVRVVRALSLESQVGDAFGASEGKSFRDGVAGKRLEARLERSADMVVAAATAFVLWYGARLVLGGQLSVGDLLVFLAYLRTGFRPVRDFAKYAGRLSKAAAAADRVLDVLDETPEQADGPHALALAESRGALAFERVSFAYEPGRTALHDISFTAAPGQHVYLLGPSGSGKTTLAALLLRLYRPERGVVRVDGHDIARVTAESLRRQCSTVLQDTLLFAGTVRENIACGVTTATDAEVMAAAELADAAGFIAALPLGYDTPLGERGVALSSGQRQRLAIARAAIRRAPIVILDEPTTGLDEHSRSQVLDALSRLCEGRTTLFITHELDLAERDADVVVWLDHGRVLEAGSPAELKAQGGPYARAVASVLAGRTHALAG
ncbi:MAG: ABC transporter ATP-binding protein/permease [Acidobacteriota bacterium]|nr:ABC transporter ATP-binding protein/permease [Acidobacteriota bacterium]